MTGNKRLTADGRASASTNQMLGKLKAILECCFSAHLALYAKVNCTRSRGLNGQPEPNSTKFSENGPFKNVDMSKLEKLPPPDPKQNRILAALPAPDYKRLLPELEFVEMPLGWTMSESGDHVNFLHFPTSGIVSLIYDLEDGSSSEIALVGNEGMIGISIFMGGESMPSSTEVQSSGNAYRLSRKIMKREFALGGQLQHVALLYTQALICQTSQTAVCNQHHSLDQQLCRWLLMSMDRLHDDELIITQELLAKLLGVRRESVTQTLGQLQKDRLIALTRGHITVVDRPKVEQRVCECYAVVKKEYERLLPTARIGK